MKGRIVKIKSISGKFHNIFRFTRRTAEVKLPNGSTHRFDRHVLETGPAVSVLPYFFDNESQDWHVVLVEQYRPAVDAICLEAPGGLLEKRKKPQHEMARELFEEAGIEVRPQDIRVVDVQHLANSFCDQIVHLGIVDLKIKNKADLLNKIKRHNGVVSEKEFTEVKVLPLSEILKKKNLITYTLAKHQIHTLAEQLGYFSEKKATQT
ncbi:MAG: NUDIX hydrolase [Patescibacteria group bacterium]